jgi:hypothetical protein
MKNNLKQFYLLISLVSVQVGPSDDFYKISPKIFQFVSIFYTTVTLYISSTVIICF